MELHEECGIFGIYDMGGDCAQTTYYGLFALQHRGQESCGIAANNNREIKCHKDLGVVGHVFSEELVDSLKGIMAIGHVRYSTSEKKGRENAQPLTINYVKGTLALAHNGNLMNAGELRREYELMGGIFSTKSDSEVIAYAIARERLNCMSVEEAVARASKKLIGAFSLIIMSPTKLIAARDPWGFRPLCMGKRGDAVLFASESCAFDAVDAEYIREVEPGEIIVVHDGKITENRENCRGLSNMCIFEYIYFARPDSVIYGQSVHEARKEAGRFLATEYPVAADIVIGVPDSGIDAAMGYSEASRIPYGDGFVKNRYVARTFITPQQSVRESAVKTKLSALSNNIRGKRVIMIDDSIVRGTTCRLIVNILREAGAAEVHVRICSPKFIAPCYFGTDVPSTDELIGCKYSTEEIREIIGADSLGFLSCDALLKTTEKADCGFCTGCFTGTYPIEIN